MKKKWIGLRVAAGMCAALGWWGLFYPELSFTPDTVRVVCEASDGSERDVTGEWCFDSTLLAELLEASGGEIRFRSRLLTELEELFGTVRPEGAGGSTTIMQNR